jgi:carbon-monoxide dehydrogenase small subunit
VQYKVPAIECEIKINGRLFKVKIDPSTLLLDLLRDELGLTGAKRGCETGYCGCCTVLIDGRAIHSCSILAMRAKEHEILTIEGMETDEKLHPIQQAFLDFNAAQCGYCSPGMIMSARALLDSNPTPNQAEISRALSGNLCRCTGYLPIIEAVLHASQQRTR